MENKVAILIDAENVSYKNAKQIIDIMSEKGEIVVKDVVADWGKMTSSKCVSNEMKGEILHHTELVEGWRKEVSNFSMTASQQFTYVSGKNTSDIAIVIKAMKLLFEKPYINIFCLVSSDSDFTRLVQELRENDKTVVGMGERKSIPEFVNAFSEFVYLGEDLESDLTIKLKKPDMYVMQDNVAYADRKESQIAPSKKNECLIGTKKLQALKDVVEEIMSEGDGRALFALISQKMKKKFSDFVPANYNCKSFEILMEKVLPFMPDYKLHKQPQKNSDNPTAVIKMLTKDEKRIAKK